MTRLKLSARAIQTALQTRRLLERDLVRGAVEDPELEGEHRQDEQIEADPDQW